VVSADSDERSAVVAAVGTGRLVVASPGAVVLGLVVVLDEVVVVSSGALDVGPAGASSTMGSGSSASVRNASTAKCTSARPARTDVAKTATVRTARRSLEFTASTMDTDHAPSMRAR